MAGSPDQELNQAVAALRRSAWGIDPDRAAARRQRFEEALAGSRGLLLELTAEGADPLFVLIRLLRMAEARPRGGEVPRVRTLRYPSRTFGVTIEEQRAAAPGRVRAIVAASQRLRPPWPRRRRPGPQETRLSFEMAILAHHLRRATGRPHWEAIAHLVRVWAPWARGEHYLTGAHVARRARRVRREHPREFVCLVQSAQRYRQTWQWALAHQAAQRAAQRRPQDRPAPPSGRDDPSGGSAPGERA